jgi:hypothetical protein
VYVCERVPRYVSQASHNYAAILQSGMLDHRCAITRNPYRFHEACWMAAATTPMGLTSGALPAPWALGKGSDVVAPTGTRPRPSVRRTCMLAAHVAHKHNLAAGSVVGLFWIETASELFQQHMFRFHYRQNEHPNALLHCTADTSVFQQRIGGDVPMAWQRQADGVMEYVNFGLVRL